MEDKVLDSYLLWLEALNESRVLRIRLMKEEEKRKEEKINQEILKDLKNKLDN